MLAWLLLLAQLQAVPAEVKPQRPVDVRALVDRARSLPPEFSADLQLRLAGSPLIPDIQWKRELIEEAFRGAAHAPMPYRLRTRGTTDSRPSQQAASNDIEALTLRMRAVDAMLALDPQRALALYQSVTPPEPADVPCREILTPNVALYYETAAKIFEQSFTPKQREKGDDLHFLRERIAEVRSPVDVAPALRLIHSAKVTEERKKDLTAAYASALDRVSGSDRMFGSSEVELFAGSAASWFDRTLFVPALRAYIVRQASSPRCSDRMDPKRPLASVTLFNALVANIDPAGQQYKPITPEESKPLKDDGAYEEHIFWRSPRSKQVLDALKWLNHGNRDLPGDQRFWTAEERASLEWNQHFMDLLKLVEGWKEEEEEAPEDHLWMAAHTYGLLARLAPPGTPRENAMGNYLTFLETHYPAAPNRNLWFGLVRQMLDAARTDKDPKDREWILERLARSRDPIISLYAQIGRRLGP